MTGLVLKGVSKAFGENVVLDDISLETAEREFLVLLGPSGCGKSTCLRLIAGLESPDSGEIYINSRRIDHLPPKKRQVAMVFQNYSLYPHMTVRKNLAFPLKIARISSDQINETIESTAALLGLTDKLDSRPGQLSGGQRQRVALGRAIVRRPSIFLLDEPLSNLDADLRVRMRREIVRIQREMGCTAVYVTHDQSEALSMADRIVLLNQGRIVQIGTPQELYDNPTTLFTANFIGQPQINLIKANIMEGLTSPLGMAVNNPRLLSEHKCIVGIRPEHIKITPSGDYKASVTECEYNGDSYKVTINFQESSLYVQQPQFPIETGAEVNFSIDRTRLHYFSTVTGERLVGQTG